MLNEHDPDLTQGAFVLATQNEDLAILKLLVQHAKPKMNSDGYDVELSQMNQSNWQEWLFGQDNVFLPKLIAKETDLAIFLKKIYKEEFNEEYPISSNDSYDVGNQTTDALEDAKTLFELQSQQGDLDLNMNLNLKPEINLKLNLKDQLEL